MTQLLSPFVKSQENPADDLPGERRTAVAHRNCSKQSHISMSTAKVQSMCLRGWVMWAAPAGYRSPICWAERPHYCVSKRGQFSHLASSCCCSDKASDSRSILSLFLHSSISFLSANPNYWNDKDISLLAIIISALIGFGLEIFAPSFLPPLGPPAWFYCSLTK